MTKKEWAWKLAIAGIHPSVNLTIQSAELEKIVFRFMDIYNREAQDSKNAFNSLAN